MKTTINGRLFEIDDETLHPDETAVDLIRERAYLTGTKLVCGGGVCGACTVLVDGTPMTSCLLPARHLDGRSVQTIEAFHGDQLHPIQKAFMACDGLQCGYCTPGFINESIAFFDRWRAEHGATTPSRDEIAAALAGHLCRCGAYQGIFAAVAGACAGEFDEMEAPTPLRHEALAKVTGAAQYTTDVNYREEGQLEGVFLRSSLPHAVVEGVDISAALSMEGVHAFVDLLDEAREVTYVGQEIGALAAVDRRTAVAAVARIKVYYRPLPAVIGLDEALAANAPPACIGDKKNLPGAGEGFVLPGRWSNNTRSGYISPTSRRSRRARRLLQQAAGRQDPLYIHHTFENPAQVHTTFEPHACVAHWHDDRHLTVHASTQSVHLLAAEIAKRFELPEENVEVLAAHIGGGFGGKQGLQVETIAAVSLARRTERPVRVVLDRLEEISYAALRPGARVDLEMVAREDGEILAYRATAHNDSGIAIGGLVGQIIGLMTSGAPRDLTDFDVINNTPPGKPFRGPNGPQGFWAADLTVDELAHRLGRDPLDLRRQWYRDHELRNQLYDWAETIPAWQERQPAGSERGRFRRGIGLASAAWLFIYNPHTGVEVTSRPEGLLVRTSIQDMGNGARTVLAQAVADVFGLKRGDVMVEIGTSRAPFGPISGGSQVTNSVYGPAAAAAQKVRDRLIATAARRLELAEAAAAPGGIDHAGGYIGWDELLPELLPQLPPFTEIEQRGAERGPLGIPLVMPGDKHAPSIGLGTGMSHGLVMTEVEVDTRLGKIRPRQVWSGIAAGRIFVPELACSQVEGGVIQGLGYALYEEKLHDPASGNVLTFNLEDYRIPGIGDVPPIDVHFIEEGFEHIRSQGIGLSELATVGVAASVGNAIFNATGWRPTRTPVLPREIVTEVN